MGFDFSTRIFHFSPRPPLRNLLLKTHVIVLSSFSTSQFYRKTFPLIFQECSKKNAHEPGRQAHARMIVSGFRPTVWSSNYLLQMYIKCSCSECATKVFHRMPEKNCGSWNSMIFGYSTTGEMVMAQSLFDSMPERNVISWNSLITGYLQNGNCLKSIKVFQMMGRASVACNETTLAVVVKACAMLKDYGIGVQIHGVVVKLGFDNKQFTGNAILSMYAKCQMLDQARQFFDGMLVRNSVSWNAIISGCVQNDELEGALELFKKMQSEGGGVGRSVYCTVGNICSKVANVGLGKQIHAQIIKQQLQSHVSIINTLVDMYSKCGNMQDSILMFQKSSNRNVVTWNTMICASAAHGCGNEALQVFEKMLLEKVMPNHVTFMGVLHACAHCGLVDEALHYLYIMHSEYGVLPDLLHYSCVVDALGRCGRVNDALKLTQEMPLKPHDGIWMSLLSNCKMHGNVKVAEIAATSLLQLDPQSYAAYVILSDIYADAGMWDEASKMRRIMRRRRLKKQPGCSWIEIQGEVHMFVVGDKAHPRFDEIDEKLDMLMAEMKSDVNEEMIHHLR